jgi:hypothetical protein
MHLRIGYLLLAIGYSRLRLCRAVPIAIFGFGFAAL